LEEALEEILIQNKFFPKQIVAILSDIMMYQKQKALKNYLEQSGEMNDDFKINCKRFVVENKYGNKLISLKFYDKSIESRITIDGSELKIEEDLVENGIYQKEHLIRLELVVYSAGLKYFSKSVGMEIKEVSRVKYFFYLFFLELNKNRNNKRYSLFRQLLKALKSNFTKEDRLYFEELKDWKGI
jgi:hypothetical protein